MPGAPGLQSLSELTGPTGTARWAEFDMEVELAEVSKVILDERTYVR